MRRLAANPYPSSTACPCQDAPVSSAEEPPAAFQRTDTLIVGGGALGCATAYELARRGLDIVLVERGSLNREASGSNAGTLHIQIPAFHFRTHYLAWETLSAERQEYFRATNRLFAESGRAWATLERELGADLGVRLGGGFMVAETPEDMELLRAKADYENRVGIRTEVMSTPEMLARAPHLSPRLAGGSYCAAEGFANPLLVGPAYLRRAQELGARVRVQSRVCAIEQEPSGAYRVETTTGRLWARRVVLAAGAQTAEVAAMLGARLPIIQHPLQVMVTEPWPPILTQLIQHASRHLSLRQTQYGTFVIGGGWPGVDDPRPGRVPVSVESIAGNSAVAVDVLPPLRDVRLLRVWGAMTTAAGRFNRIGFLGALRQPPGVYVMVAGGWGFTLSPVLGRLMAELIVDGRTELDARWFDLDHLDLHS